MSEAQAPRRVLIVEDEARLRDMLSRAVRDMEFDAQGVPSAESGLQLMAESEFDIVLTDLNLPGMYGLELCERIRERWPAVQVIVLTGYGDLDVARRAIRLDVVDFLTKPCSLGDLETALDRALRRRAHHITSRRVPTIDAPSGADDLHADEDADARDIPGTLRDAERTHILTALERNDGNRQTTADELGISVRTLYYRLKEYQGEGYWTGG